MKIRHKELETTKENPFANCRLGREPYATALTSIVSTYADGFVLAINNEWGAGKTTFVKMWEQQLRQNEFETIYFNAWENDFDSNPLVALLAELKTLQNDTNSETYKSIAKNGAVFIKNIAPSVVKMMLKHLGVDTTGFSSEIVESTVKGSTEILEEEVEAYTAKKETIVKFRDSLKDFVDKTNSRKPIVFIVDELDRCRPTYAVELLEQIKHLFTVSGIVFVLSIDKEQLCSSIKGFYGSESINSNEYLRRFIDLEYSIPQPATKDFVKYLFDYFSFKDFYMAEVRLKYGEFDKDAVRFTWMAEFLLEKSRSTLREQEKIFGLTRLVLRTFNINEYNFPSLFFILVYLKITQPEYYNKIDRNELSPQQLSDFIGELLSRSGDLARRMDFGYLVAEFLWFYNNNENNKNRSKLIYMDAQNNPATPVKSDFANDGKPLADYFNEINFSRFSSLSLEHLMNKINLTAPIIIK